MVHREPLASGVTAPQAIRRVGPFPSVASTMSMPSRAGTHTSNAALSVTESRTWPDAAIALAAQSALPGASFERSIFVDREMKRPLKDVMHLDHVDGWNDKPNIFTESRRSRRLSISTESAKERIECERCHFVRFPLPL